MSVDNEGEDESSPFVPPIPVPELPTGSSDAKAALEESALALGVDLNQQQATNNVRKLIREDRIARFLHAIECLFIVVVGMLIVAGAFTIGWHHLTPQWLHYLSTDELGNLQGLLFNGVVGGAVATLAKKHVLDKS